MRLKRARSSLKKSKLLTDERPVEAKNRRSLYNNRLISVFKDEPTGHVCIVRSVGGIGDVLMITPAIRQIKERYPLCKVTLALDRHRTRGDIYYELLKNAPFIDDIIDARLVKRKDYNKVVDISSVCMPYERRDLPSRNRIDIFSNSLGFVTLDNPLPFFQLTDDELEFADIFFKEAVQPIGPVIALHTASNDKKRSWDPKQQLAFIRKLKATILGVKFLVFDFNRFLFTKGVPEDMKDYVFDCSTVSVRDMAALINKATLFVGPDSGPMHLAGALRKPAVVVFGAIPPEARINHYESHTAVRMDELGCIGCWYKPCPYNLKCMKFLEADRVLAEVLRRYK